MGAKESKAAFRKLDEMQQDYTARENSILELATRSWENLKNKVDNTSLYERIAIESRDFVEIILFNVIKLYPHTGISGAAADNEINILFRIYLRHLSINYCKRICPKR
ncbi:hypothetical protein KUH03_04040 [Sphingobacterium sp. E70]|uniref:hypothetical protein n=1 Tax=Sphingobacterium sp. E70 TaxID=2853439 RepID=UPI00211C19D2|nr:hypothetical protein [Sphingobacterium sp. E70]ULT26123.1 hypothetical protein KUH03_04040 [Sphingobacterium sp. E70]